MAARESRDPTRDFLAYHREPGAEFAGPSVAGLQDGCYPLVGWLWRGLRKLCRWGWTKVGAAGNRSAG